MRPRFLFKLIFGCNALNGSVEPQDRNLQYLEPQKGGAQHDPVCGELSPRGFLISSSHLTPPCSLCLTFWLHGPFSIYIFSLPSELDPPHSLPARDTEITSQLTTCRFPPPSLNLWGFSTGLAVPGRPHTVMDLTPWRYMSVRPPNSGTEKSKESWGEISGRFGKNSKFPLLHEGRTPHPAPTWEERHYEPHSRIWAPYQ